MKFFPTVLVVVGCNPMSNLFLLHRRKDQRRHANRRRKRIPRAWRSCPRFQTFVSRIFRATRVMNLLLQVLLFPRGTRDQGAAPARGRNGKCSSVLQDTLDIQRQETERNLDRRHISNYHSIESKHEKNKLDHSTLRRGIWLYKVLYNAFLTMCSLLHCWFSTGGSGGLVHPCGGMPDGVGEVRSQRFQQSAIHSLGGFLHQLI